jgi:hypothetical protein
LEFRRYIVLDIVLTNRIVNMKKTRKAMPGFFITHYFTPFQRAISFSYLRRLGIIMRNC